MQKSRINFLDEADTFLFWKEYYRFYNRKTRDRPGGHLFRTYYGHLDSNYNGGADYRRYVKKKIRSQNKKTDQRRSIWLFHRRKRMIMYLRKVHYNNFGIKGYYVEYYTDPEATNRVCRNRNMSKPTKRNKWVMYNCARYRVEWLPDKVE